MPETVFFSWQADRETRGCRNLIERALHQACQRISADTSVEEAKRGSKFEVDRDTKNVAGQPPIVDTIFRKIDKAAVFVPDLTFIGQRADGRPTPNPNVLVEYGWALNSLKHARIVPVMNVAYGEPKGDAMPFDMRHLRNPITYDCPETLGEAERRTVRDKLSKDLESAIRLVLQSPEYLSSRPQPPAPKIFQPHNSVSPGRFKAPGSPIGIVADRFRPSVKIYIPNGPVRWFRLMPTADPGRVWSVDELETAMQTPFVAPLAATTGSFGSFRSQEGFGIYAAFHDQPEQAKLQVFAFTTGEVWSTDTYSLAAYRDANQKLTVGAGALHAGTSTSSAALPEA